MQNVVNINGVDYNAKDDGETHINVYSQGKTVLGRFLSNFTRTDSETNHGKFRSLEGYYHYLRGLIALEHSQRATKEHSVRLNDLRYVDGNFAQALGRKIRNDFIKDSIQYHELDEEFLGHFKDALISKVRHREFGPMFYDSSLPFTHYYIVGNGGIYHHPRFDWLSNMLEDIRYGM